MKQFFTLVIFSCFAISTFAQANADSLAYQLQRKKINTMLEARTQKFGQYDQSLKVHTGIFGFQTKKDIRRSNEILMDIAKTDDSIYKELKILLDFRTFQQTRVQTHASETEESAITFMNTINKLRGQVDKLKSDAVKQEGKADKTRNLFIVIIIIASILLVISFTRRRRA
jgi:hypothetical protein